MRPRARAILARATALALSAGLLAVAPAAGAQSVPAERAAAFARDAVAQTREARGAVALLRLAAQADWLDPALILDRVHAIGADSHAPPARRALALVLEADLRAQLGEDHEAQQIFDDLGFITRWQVVGPFDNEGRAGFDREMEPERDRGARPDAGHAYDGKERQVRWRAMPDVARRGYVPLDAVSRPAENSCSFAHTTVFATADDDAVLWLGAVGQMRVYVNAQEVYRDDAVRGAFPDRAGVPVRLHRGGNRVLLKVCTDDHGAGFYARFTRADGSPRVDLRVDPDPASAPEQSLPGATPTPSPAPARARRRGHDGAAAAGATAAAGAGPTLPTPRGTMAELRAAADAPHATAQALEDYARYLSLTSSDDTAAPSAADLAQRAAEAGPNTQRWLLVAQLASDRNRRLAAIRHAQELSPDDAEVLTAAGRERRLSSHSDDALAVLDRAVAADDGFPAARVERALALDAAGLPLAASRELDEAALRAPRSSFLLRTRAAVAERAQLFDQAYALRRAYLRVRDDDVGAHEALAREARARGDADLMRRESERMLALAPGRLGLYLNAAELIEAAGDGDAALGILGRAVEIAPDEPALWRARGELEVRLGRVEEGTASMRRALALSPQDSTLRQHVESLEPAVARPDERLAEAPEAFLARRVQNAAQGAGYKVLSLAELTVRTVYQNGLSGSFRQSAFQVITPEGAEASRTFTIPVQPDSQRFELRGARIYHPDDSVDESVGMAEYSLNGGASRMYYDSRAVVLSFPRLSPGDVVEVRWRVDDVGTRNAFADYFGDLYVMQGDVPRARVQYTLRIPGSRQLFFHVPQLPNLERTEATDGNDKVYNFLASNVAAVPPEEHSPGATEEAAYLHVSTYRAWEDVGRWYWGLISDQLQADDRVRNIVREATRGLTSPRDKVRAIYDWVIHNTRYVALEFGIHGFLPYRVPEVCSRGFGDCKDKASTIVSMLREVGIDASVVLVRTRNNGNVDTSPASLAVFDHAIAYVPPMEGFPDGIFLDGTAQSSGMDELPSMDQGAMCLIVNQRGEARLAQIPIVSADHNRAVSAEEMTLDAAGSATLHVTSDVSGPAAGGVRASLEAVATRAERLEHVLSGNFPGAHVSDVHTNDMNDVDHPAHYEYTATVPQVGTRQGATLLVPLSAPLNLTRDYAARSSRVSDVVLNGPATVEQTVTLRLPAGASVVEVPEGANVDSPFVRLNYSIERQGSSIVVHRVVTYVVQRVPAAHYAEFREACQRIDDALSRRATVRMPGSP